jgi:hypothetical protein
MAALLSLPSSAVLHALGLMSHAAAASQLLQRVSFSCQSYVYDPAANSVHLCSSSTAPDALPSSASADAAAAKPAVQWDSLLDCTPRLQVSAS